MRKWLARPSLLILILTTGIAAISSSSRAADRNEASFSYGTHTRQGLDAYWYDSDTPRPALVIFHGGYWHSGGKADWAATARYFADQGFAVFSADYRYNTDAAWPAQRNDGVAVINWIKTHAADFDIDPTHIAVLGSQAGGQIATSLATTGAGNTLINGAVALSAPSSPYRAWSDAPTTAATAARRTVRDEAVILHRCYPSSTDTACWARWNDSVAKNQASGADDAPMYLIHGSDETIPATHSTDLRDAETAAGMNPDDITVRTVTGTTSGGPLLNDEALKADVLTWLKTRAVTGTATATPTGISPVRRGDATTGHTKTNDDPITETTPPGGDVQATSITTKTYAYGSDPAQKLDAYYTKTSTKQPALVIIHGGYWYEGDKSGWDGTAQWFAERGYAVFSINYRLVGASGWTAQRTDVLNALAWIRSHASTFTVDPKRVVALGSSAGGHLATTVGTYGGGKGYFRGVVALSPVASPYRAYNDGQADGASGSKQKLRDTSTLLARCHPTKSNTTCWNRWVDAVVKNHASSGDAPMYLLHFQDDFVPATHSTDLCTALKAKGVSCTVTVASGTGHASDILKISGMHTKILNWLKAHD